LFALSLNLKERLSFFRSNFSMLNDAASSKISLMEEPQVSVAVNNNLLEVF